MIRVDKYCVMHVAIVIRRHYVKYIPHVPAGVVEMVIDEFLGIECINEKIVHYNA